MSAEIFNLAMRLKERNLLKEVLPLEFPFSCNVFAANVCNFKCYYCVNADFNKKGELGIRNDMLSYQDFVNIADNISGSGKLKSMIFAGVGEPLLNKEITKMFRYAKEKQIAEKLEIITNGACLTKELCEDIVESGLDRIRISLNGLTEEDYKQNCAVDVDVERFQSNLAYLYEYRNAYREKHHKNMQIYIKIMDVMVEDEQKKTQFYKEYETICDEIYIESLIPINNVNDNPQKFKKNFFGESKADDVCRVCPQPFYSFSIGTKGEVYPCCQIPVPRVFGSLLDQKLSEIWNGKEYISFLISILNGSFKQMPVCSECKKYEYMTLESDKLDGSEEQLIEKYSKL